MMSWSMLVGVGLVVVQTSVPLADVRAIQIKGHVNAVGDHAKVGACLIEKLQAQGPFTFPDDASDAHAVLTFDAIRIPSGSSRVLMGRRPEVRATLTAADGRVLWRGSNKYSKSTTVWGTGTDIHCGLANGLAIKLTKAISAG